MKTILFHVAAMLVTFALPAMAGPFGLPDHVQDGWRDTGCDEAFNVEIKNDEGEVLYLNNPTCPDPSPGDALEEDSAEGPGDGGEGPGDGGEGPGDGGEGPGDGGEGPGDGGEGPGDGGEGPGDGEGGGNPCRGNCGNGGGNGGGNGTGNEGGGHGPKPHKKA